ERARLAASKVRPRAVER
ncbi:MAG: hypothetical protein ACOVQT_13005, partial [Rubrivivax sp.]